MQYGIKLAVSLVNYSSIIERPKQLQQNKMASSASIAAGSHNYVAFGILLAFFK